MKRELILLVILLIIAGCCEESTVLESDYSFLIEIPSFRYTDNCFYFEQPEIMYQTYSEEEVVGLGLPSGWANNAIKLDNEGRWYLNNEYYPNLPDFYTLRVFIDDGNPDNNNSAIDGYEIDVLDTVYHFDECTIGVDFNIENFMLIIQHDIYINKYAIGVTYTQNDGIQVGNPDSSSIEVKLLKKPFQDFINNPEYWNLQARNSYYYGNVFLYGSARIIIGYKNDHAGPLITSIPDSIDTGSNIYTFADYLHLDTNEDGLVTTEDTIFFLSKFLVQLPFIYPFKSLEGMYIYQSGFIDIEDWNYYVRIEDIHIYRE